MSFLKIPTGDVRDALLERIMNDSDWRTPRIKLANDTGRKYTIPTPTKTNPDGVTTTDTFEAVVFLSLKNMSTFDELKEPREKRELYLFIEGKITPYQFYVSPSAVRNWLNTIKRIKDVAGVPYLNAVIRFGSERVSFNNLTWTKPTFEFVRVISDEEAEYVREIARLMHNRVMAYRMDRNELEALENEALGIISGEVDDVISKATVADIEEAEPRKAVKTPKKPVVVEDDEDIADDEEEEEVKPKPRGKRKPEPVLTEDEDEELDDDEL